jgi:predicted site-specific integrase-resolvase
MQTHLRQKDLAARWHVSPRTLERWRWTGAGPRFLKVGGRVIYRLEDVEAHERAQLRRGGPSIRGTAAPATVGEGL